ncbi:hypothetical protein AMATHDRAFT_70067 [Amanita thiersii Skay4041]|uniref:Uncharacterized protein n=1 Tax=Amanita thiersii Skay4041 TaxID=703135 RepID=A0A2A9NF35_9AGAR|nr:hypothetical protein AMATHDRAFT_70067 [Amanita thiersii Skay4041]
MHPQTLSKHNSYSEIFKESDSNRTDERDLLYSLYGGARYCEEDEERTRWLQEAFPYTPVSLDQLGGDYVVAPNGAAGNSSSSSLNVNPNMNVNVDVTVDGLHAPHYQHQEHHQGYRDQTLAAAVWRALAYDEQYRHNPYVQQYQYLSQYPALQRNQCQYPDSFLQQPYLYQYQSPQQQQLQRQRQHQQHPVRYLSLHNQEKRARIEEWLKGQRECQGEEGMKSFLNLASGDDDEEIEDCSQRTVNDLLSHSYGLVEEGIVNSSDKDGEFEEEEEGGTAKMEVDQNMECVGTQPSQRNAMEKEEEAEDNNKLVEQDHQDRTARGLTTPSGDISSETLVIDAQPCKANDSTEIANTGLPTPSEPEPTYAQIWSRIPTGSLAEVGDIYAPPKTIYGPHMDDKHDSYRYRCAWLGGGDGEEHNKGRGRGGSGGVGAGVGVCTAMVSAVGFRRHVFATHKVNLKNEKKNTQLVECRFLVGEGPLDAFVSARRCDVSDSVAGCGGDGSGSGSGSGREAMTTKEDVATMAIATTPKPGLLRMCGALIPANELYAHVNDKHWQSRMVWCWFCREWRANREVLRDEHLGFCWRYLQASDRQRERMLRFYGIKMAES